MAIRIDPRAVVEDGAQIGDGTSIWHFCHVRNGSKIGKDCNIGHAVYIDEGVSIGDRAKIQNKVSIFHGVSIGDDVFIGPHVCFTNDMFPRAFNTEWEVTPTHIEDGVSIGANSTIRCGITIGRFALIGAGALVTKDVPPFALVLGSPGKIVGQVCECAKVLNMDSSLPLDPNEIKCTHTDSLNLPKE